jgi:hypothetical protein
LWGGKRKTEFPLLDNNVYKVNNYMNKKVIIVGVVLSVLMLSWLIFIKLPLNKANTNTVSFFDLISNHEQYNNKEICTTGEYFSNFETAQLRPPGYAKSNENVIFLDIDRNLEKLKLNCNSNSKNCKFSVLVCGIYESKIDEHTGFPGYYGGISCPNCNSQIIVKDIRKFLCPQYSPPIPGWCNDGKIIPGAIDKYGCQHPPQCKRD